jgi:hypothetical protein
MKKQIGLAIEIEGRAPEIPDWAYDQHTAKGRSMGRGIDFSRKESTKLVPAPKPDPYEPEAYRLWKLKRGEE